VAVVTEDLHVSSGSQARPWGRKPTGQSLWNKGIRIRLGMVCGPLFDRNHVALTQGMAPPWFTAGLAMSPETAGPERVARGTLGLHRPQPPQADDCLCPRPQPGGVTDGHTARRARQGPERHSPSGAQPLRHRIRRSQRAPGNFGSGLAGTAHTPPSGLGPVNEKGRNPPDNAGKNLHFK
jgi:hypothetical protein